MKESVDIVGIALLSSSLSTVISGVQSWVGRSFFISSSSAMATSFAPRPFVSSEFGRDDVTNKLINTTVERWRNKTVRAFTGRNYITVQCAIIQN